MTKTTAPYISCIVTIYSEGALARIAIDSLLSQSFTDFEILIVDDGASEETRQVVLSYDDSRIVHIRQANDGLSSARNRALSAARGEYICFLDADDSRPIWAIAEMARVARETEVDVVFLPGLLSELRTEVLPFYDSEIFGKLANMDLRRAVLGSPRFLSALRHLAAIEPQSANKLVRRSFLEEYRLRFPAGLFFEDMVFHNALVLCLRSYAIAEVPCFTYFRRYARPQITSTTGTLRFDALSSAETTLAMFAGSAYYQDPILRMVLLAAVFKLLKWCEETLGHQYRWAYRQGLLALLAHVDKRMLQIPVGSTYDEALSIAAWVGPSLDYLAAVSQEARLLKA